VELLANLHREPTGEQMKKEQFFVEERGDPNQDVRRQSEKRMMLEQINACIDQLPPVQQRIVREHHAEVPKSLRELSRDLDLSHQRVRDLYKEAIKRIQFLCRK
jgi:RNA polymerase sigma factor (sigma-70 family)